ncbi:MAG: helix-turn-helix transcriptional regulator [Anaerolineales bacterium]|nr:helix-turn-helix transcriptional regulator [Anaerolineales bacterium]
MNIYSDIGTIMEPLDEQTAAEIAELFRALGDSTRIRIISALTGGEKSVGELAELSGSSESTTSHHLRHLRQLRLVQTRRDGRFIFYSLDDDHVATVFHCGLEHVQHG